MFSVPLFGLFKTVHSESIIDIETNNGGFKVQTIIPVTKTIKADVCYIIEVVTVVTTIVFDYLSIYF